MTFFNKYVFSLCVFIINGVILLSIFESDTFLQAIFAFFIASIFSLLSYFFLWKNKQVWLGDEKIIISDFRNTIEIPYSEIKDISPFGSNNLYYISIKFKMKTFFGERIIFQPYYRFPFGFSEHPVVDRLWKLINNPPTINKDWNCPKCNFLNDGEKYICNRCKYSLV